MWQQQWQPSFLHLLGLGVPDVDLSMVQAWPLGLLLELPGQISSCMGSSSSFAEVLAAGIVDSSVCKETLRPGIWDVSAQEEVLKIGLQPFGWLQSLVLVEDGPLVEHAVGMPEAKQEHQGHLLKVPCPHSSLQGADSLQRAEAKSGSEGSISD